MRGEKKRKEKRKKNKVVQIFYGVPTAGVR